MTSQSERCLDVTSYSQPGDLATNGYSTIERTLHIQERYGAPPPTATRNNSPKLLIATVLVGGGLIVGLTGSIAWNLALGQQHQELTQAKAEALKLQAWQKQVKASVCN